MKFFGQIGFIYEHEVKPGIWSNSAVERPAYGDILSNVRRWDEGQTVADSVVTSNEISVIADRFLCEHMGAMRYVRWNGTVWDIKSVKLVRPRAFLTLGEVYNGEQAHTEEEGPESPEEPPEDVERRPGE